MGATLAKEALVRFSGVGYDAFRVLMLMALQALDKTGEDGTPARLYFGGADALLLVLRPAASADPKKRKNAERDLERVMEDLVAAGAVSRLVGKACADNRQTWRLVLKPTGEELPSRVRTRNKTARRKARLELEEAGVTPRAVPGVTPREEPGVTPRQSPGSHPGPRRHEEPQEDLKEDPANIGRLMRTGSARAREDDDGSWPGHFADVEDPPRLRSVR